MACWIDQRLREVFPRSGDEFFGRLMLCLTTNTQRQEWHISAYPMFPGAYMISFYSVFISIFFPPSSYGFDSAWLPREDFHHLKESWLSYVHMERKKEGMTKYLLRGRRTSTPSCACGKSRTSYPHWPPSCQTEAMDQLRCLLGQSYPHREHLAHSWMSFFLGKRVAQTSKADDERTISLAQRSCPTLVLATSEEKGGGETGGKRKKVDCATICQRVLGERSCHCLCSCSSHREECPVHRCA